MAEAKKTTTKKPAVKKTAAKKATEAPEVATGEVTQTPIVEAVTIEESAPEAEAKESKAPAKAGKRSEKALKEAEAKQAKEERKEAKAEETEKPKVQQKPPRTKLERRSKNYRKVAELIEKGKAYGLKEGLELAVKTSPVKFDASVELHVRLGVDPRQADQNIRDTIVLPAGSGKTVRVAVFAEADDVATAKKAGADVAGNEEFLQQLDKGTVDFDVLIATPAQMPKLGKYARLLGPKGLMPNPKSGTVTTDVTKAVTEAKAGKVEYRVDSTGIVHLAIGKVSFGAVKLHDNAQAVVASIKGNRPSSIKGSYVKSIHLTTSMGPSISVDIAEAN
jgi:large subunit ribosomal protein L1